VGGVSERPTGREGGEILVALESPTVEGTLVLGMPSAFAGGRKNAGLGRSVSCVVELFLGARTYR